MLATPTKIRGVALPDEAEVESKVTHAIPVLSLLYPLESEGSAIYVPKEQSTGRPYGDKNRPTCVGERRNLRERRTVISGLP